MDFVHLHLHTQYSFLDGAILIDKLISKAKQLGMKSVAITDHGAMHGIVEFYHECRRAGIKPVIGCEMYISPGSRKDREYTRGQTSNFHLILLAENNTGLANLFQLASVAQLEGFYSRPRIDKEVLEKYHEGIIALSACLGGEVPQKILGASYQEARDTALEYQRIMGKGNFYLELQQNGIPEQTIVNKQLVNISEETGIPLVATCDCHYLNRGEHTSHTVLMCIQTATTLSHPNRMETASEELYVKSAEEMHESFSAYPEALANSVRIAERCHVDIEFGNLHLPFYDVPDNFTPESYLRHLAREGLKERLSRMPEEVHGTYRDRLEMELDVIILKGYDGYFLIVWDFINFARQNHIPVGPGRGSGAGSLVAYSLKITDIDPIALNLLFERFLNPERPSLPDFDIDFCVKRREEVIRYVRDKYGEDRVAQIVTFGRLSGRSIIRDVSRVMEIPLSVADKLAKTIPEAPGMTLTKALSIDPNIEREFKTIEQGDELLQHSLKLEGLLRQAGMHAAGVVIADRPLVEYVPLCRGKDNEVMVQYEKGLLEKLGLVKFDFLGLANLTIIEDTVQRIHREVDPSFDMAAIPFDEKDVYDMLSRGESTGVFQLESDGMRRLMKKLEPSVLEDIIALNALFRPGPIGSGMLDDFCDRKHGVQPIVYPLPQLEPILKETYGVILYQEQVMEIARTVAGYSLGAADILRRAMGKKDIVEMQQQRSIFIDGSEKLAIQGARKLGTHPQKAAEIFDLMEKFADYGFNKSHSAAYAVLAYQTAYLRCKFPAQFLASAMSLDEVKLERIIPYVSDAQKIGINVHPPDINRSGLVFEHIGGAIWFGMRAVKNVGQGAAELILEERGKNGPYKSIYNFCERVDLRAVNKKVLESLIYGGAFDCFGKNRRQHLEVLEKAMEQGQRKQKMKAQGLRSIEDFLFDGEEEGEAEEFYPDLPEMPDSELLSAEKAVLSIYFTSHPVSNAIALSQETFDTVEKVCQSPNGAQVRLLGIVTSVRKLLTNKNHPTKKKESMASFMIEDLTGSMEAVAFPRAYAQCAGALSPENIVVVEGVWRQEGDRFSIQADQVFPFTEALEKFAKGLCVNLSLDSAKNDDVDRLAGILTRNKGGLPVMLNLLRMDEYAFELLLPPSFAVKPSEELFRQLGSGFGSDACRIITDFPAAAEKYQFERFYTEGDMQQVESGYDS